MSSTRSVHTLWILLVLGVCTLIACGDDGASNDSNTTPSETSGTSETTSQTTSQTSTTTSPDDVGPDTTEDATATEDASPDTDNDTSNDVSEDVPDEDVPFQGGGECEIAFDCEHAPRQCIDQVCTLVPSGQVFVETNYVLEQPEELANVVSVLKGFLNQTGFFMTDFGPIDGNEIVVTYGGGDFIETAEDGTKVYAWQVADPTILPTFTIRPDIDPDNPTAGDSWISDIFDYRLIAAFEFNGQRSGIGFQAQETIVRMTFNPDQTNIVRGTIEGYMTRAEAESREITLGEDCDDPNSLCCLLSTGVCPSYECGVSEVMDSVADVLDCNGAIIDSDVDPNIEGHDAYRMIINFASERVTRRDPGE